MLSIGRAAQAVNGSLKWRILIALLVPIPVAVLLQFPVEAGVVAKEWAYYARGVLTGALAFWAVQKISA